ncbi:MBG domain-containing protein [Paraflavitalea pollutisoli]|uniref:MBG domain-containing protein n=1 Tax=Paraflavitalea pollutisoli TaxID=3034143 RepID=UPI0023ED41BF|nr:MBG domain-containing protein [Paraflavitalea sp. H1-2-19X]
MRYFLAVMTALLFTLTASAQSLVPVYYPSYMQGNGSGGDRVPYVCRFTVKDLKPNATYRYVNHFATNTSDTWVSGTSIFIRPDGSFDRVEYPDVWDVSVCGEFTTDASGSYTGWFINEPDANSTFTPGQTAYFRLMLNDGGGGTWGDSFIASPEPVTMINFSSGADGGTAIRSTPATEGIAKNFVFLYANANPAPGEAPVMGTYIESDGTDNSAATFFAPFYGDHVNAVDKAWGGIIPNNLANGIRRIAQYSLADGSEIGYKTSADGKWAQAGGGAVNTVNPAGGLTTVIELDGTVITLGVPIAQPQTITFAAPGAKTYGDAAFDPGASASSQLTVQYRSSNPAVATVSGNTLTIKGAGTTDITASQPGNGDFLAATPITHTLTINKVTLTITAEDKVKVQGDPMPALTVLYSGFVNGENESVLATPPVVNTTATDVSPAGDYELIPAGAVAANYDFTYVKGKLSVSSNKQPQTITFAALAPVTYGAADYDPGATLSSRLPVVYTSSDPAIADIVNGKIHIKGTGVVTITATHPGNANFEPATDVQQSLTINKAGLTIRADNKTRLVGFANPVLTASYTGFVYNETVAVLITPPTISTTATPASPADKYPIRVSGAAAANYTITYIDGELTVEPLPAQVITFATLPYVRYGDAAINAGATASSGLSVQYRSSNTQVATVDANGLIQLKGAGTANITAAQPGDPYHAAAPEVTRTLTVAKAQLVIQAVDTAKLEGEANPPLLLNYSGFVNNETATSLTAAPQVSTQATTNSVPGKYVISVTGALSPNYTIAQVNGTLQVRPSLGAGQDNMVAFLRAPGQLQVNIHSVKAGKATIQVFDQQGNRLQQAMVNLAAGFNTPILPVGNITPGIYHVRVYGPEFILKNKVVIR